MREISLKVRRFEEIQAQTGMSSHLLSSRLRRLEQDGILERRVYSARPLRHEYFATEKGKDLDAVMLALRNWDLRWGGSDGEGAAAVNLTDKKTGKTIDGTWHNPVGETFSFANTNSVMSEAWKAEREANAAAFYAAKKGSTPKSVASKKKTSAPKSARSSSVSPKVRVREKVKGVSGDARKQSLQKGAKASKSTNRSR